MTKIPKSRTKNQERLRLLREHTETQRRLKEEFYKRQKVKIVKKVEAEVEEKR